MSTQDNNFLEKKSDKPTHTIRKKHWTGKRSEYELLGVAWQRDDGGLYIKLHGTQVIDGGFYAFPNKDETTTQGGQ